MALFHNRLRAYGGYDASSATARRSSSDRAPGSRKLDVTPMTVRSARAAAAASLADESTRPTSAGRIAFGNASVAIQFLALSARSVRVRAERLRAGRVSSANRAPRYTARATSR